MDIKLTFIELFRLLLSRFALWVLACRGKIDLNVFKLCRKDQGNMFPMFPMFPIFPRKMVHKRHTDLPYQKLIYEMRTIWNINY